MARRMVWVVEKIHGIPQKRAACSQCGWISEMRHYGPKGERPTNTGAVRLEFLNHNCEEFPGGIRRWKAEAR